MRSLVQLVRSKERGDQTTDATPAFIDIEPEDFLVELAALACRQHVAHCLDEGEQLFGV